MATNTSGRSAFVGSYGHIFRGFVLALAVIAALMAVLEQVGVPEWVVAGVFVFVTLAAYVVIGALARTMQVAEFYAAGRSIPAIYNGMAGAAGVIGGVGLIGLTGAVFLAGLDGILLLTGPILGLVLVAILIAPGLRKFGAYTVPDFLAVRFGPVMRLLAVAVLLAGSLGLIWAELHLIGSIGELFLGIGFETGVVLGASAVLASVVLGGARSLTWSQVAQFLVIGAAVLLPAIGMTLGESGMPIAQLGYGPQLTALEAEIGALGGEGLGHSGAGPSFLEAFTVLDPVLIFAMVATIALGIASMPHVIMRFSTARSVRGSRSAASWTAAFTVLILSAIPVIVILTEMDIVRTVVGAGIGSIPLWFQTVSGLDLASLYGLSIADMDGLMTQIVTAIGTGARDLGAVNSALGTGAQPWSALDPAVQQALIDGIVRNPGILPEVLWAEAVNAASQTAGHDGAIALSAMSLAPEGLLIAAPSVAGLPTAFAGFVVAGLLAAALSTASALALVMANSLSHDFYFRTLDRLASTAKRLVIARLFLIVVCGLTAWLAIAVRGDPLMLIFGAMALGASGLFAPLVLGIWWRRCTGAGAVAGTVSGILVSGWLIFSGLAGTPMDLSFLGLDTLTGLPRGTDLLGGAIGPDWPVLPGAIVAILGVPAAFFVALVVSVVTRAPSEQVQEFVTEIRTPRGRSYIEREREAERIREFGRGN